MEFKKLHRITALILALLIFFSSVGLSIDLHYCKGQLKSFSLIGEASSCHDSKKTCPNHAKIQVESEQEKKCCSNEKVDIEELDIDYDITTGVVLTDIQVKFISAFITTGYFENILIAVDPSTNFKETDPLPRRDIYVLFERFLI